MGLFLFFTFSYILVLALYRPAPESLKAVQIGYLANISRIKLSLLLGIIICVVFVLTSKFSFEKTDEDLIVIFGINNRYFFHGFWFVQLITHIFVHQNMFHLLTNLTGLGLSSLYERRVGPKRFFMVFLISSLFSGISIFLHTEPQLSVGISGAVFGLAAAYFTDHKNLSIKDWLNAIGMFIVFAIILSLNNNVQMPKDLTLNVDHIGHAAGAIAAILYCKIKLLDKP